MSEFVMDRIRSEFEMGVSKEMSTHLEKPAWSPKQKLALSARILANQGHGSGLAQCCAQLVCKPRSGIDEAA